ncbi:hypothetical protein E4U58_004088 [Claviceps cyperi]|nr:hypothetical protein E4U58_004088 [Claviceps cyperi]
MKALLGGGAVGEPLEGEPVGWSFLAGGGNGTPQAGQAACVSVVTLPAFEGLDGQDTRYGQVQSCFFENVPGEYVYGRQFSSGLEGGSEWSASVHCGRHEPLVNYPFVPWSPAQAPGIDDQPNYFDVPLQAPIQRETQAHGPHTDSHPVRPLAQRPGSDSQQECYYHPSEPLADYNAVDQVLRDAAGSYRPT